MNITQYPASLSLLGNLNHLVVSSDTDVNVLLQIPSDSQHGAAVTVISHIYSPNHLSQIDIELENIIRPLLSFTPPSSPLFSLGGGSVTSLVTTPWQQTSIARNFTLTVTPIAADGSTGTPETKAFTVIRAGIDAYTGTAADFLTAHFLTWQPLVKRVTRYTPEFLTYYAPSAATIRCKKVTPAGAVTVTTLEIISAGDCYTIPVSYDVIAGDTTLAYYDIYAEVSGTRVTPLHRYVPDSMRSHEEQWFLFENSLGGIDTFRAYGDSENMADHTHNVARINDTYSEYRVDTTRKFNKNTGHLNATERLWLLDFFPSTAKYICFNGTLRPIVVTESQVTYNAKALPSSYTFTYHYADQKPYLNLNRPSPGAAAPQPTTLPGFDFTPTPHE